MPTYTNNQAGITRIGNRLPIIGSDLNNWGTIINNFLSVSHNSNGTILSPIGGGGAGYVIGGGQLNHIFVATTPQVLAVGVGTGAAQDTTTNPVMGVYRKINLTTGQITGDGGEQACALFVICQGNVTNQVQPEAIRCEAVVVASSTADACGIDSGAQNSGSGVAIGGNFQAVSKGTGKSTALQLNAVNDTGTDQSVITNAFSGAAIWMWSGDSSSSWKVACGIEFGQYLGPQFDVGIHFNGQIANSVNGPIATTSIQDDSYAPTSIKINGTHTIGLDLSGGTFSTSILKTPSGAESTGSGSAALGSNCPAVTMTAPYKWIKLVTSDGSAVYMPVWK